MKEHDIEKAEMSLGKARELISTNPREALDHAVKSARDYRLKNRPDDAQQAMDVVGEASHELGTQDAWYLLTTDKQPKLEGIEEFLDENCGNYHAVNEIAKKMHEAGDPLAYFYVTSLIHIKTAIMKHYSLRRKNDRQSGKDSCSDA